MSVDKAIQLALTNVTNPYALQYLKAIPTAIEEGAEDLYHEASDYLKIQIRYALNNMGSWKGPEAREVKTVLREYVK